MDWKSDANENDMEVESYSSFQSNKTGKWIDRMELPIILIGAGLLALVILFVLFIPKKNEFTSDDYLHLVSRLDKLEKQITDLGGKDIDITEFDPSKNSVQYQQVINWIKSNAEVISETIKKLDDLENTVKTLQSPDAALAEKTQAAPPVARPEKPLPSESEAVSIAKSQPVPIVSKDQPPKQDSAKTEVPLKADPVTIQKAESKPEAPLVASEPPKPAEPPKPVVEKKPSVESPPAEVLAKPVTKKPEGVKYIFHRVEKGETLYRISRNYGLTVEKLQELNNRKKDDLLISVGQELIVRVEKQ